MVAKCLGDWRSWAVLGNIHDDKDRFVGIADLIVQIKVTAPLAETYSTSVLTGGESITPQMQSATEAAMYRQFSLPPRRRCTVSSIRRSGPFGHFINGREASIKTKQKNIQQKH